MSNVMVEAQGVRKSYGHLEILKGIDLQVQRGSVTCLIGPSGSGKTTFLRCINHLEKINAGRLYVDGSLVGYEERNGRLHEMKDKADGDVPPRLRHGVPALQPVPAHDHHGEHHRGTHPGAGPQPQGDHGRGPGPAGPGRAWATADVPTRRSSPAASSSAWPSPARWP